MSRPFNRTAYNASDMPAKIRLKEIMEATGKYVLYGDINTEHYKEYDVAFIHEDGKIVYYENEVRNDFDKIVQDFTTIHIPYRKKNTGSSFYLVWNTELLQIIMIDNSTIKKYSDAVIEVTCNHDMNTRGAYEDTFLDIPKSETQWYSVGKGFVLTKLDY